MVLDANVLEYDSSALLRFDPHDVLLPMSVVDALAASAQGTSEAARQARQAVGLAEDLVGGALGRELGNGVLIADSDEPSRQHGGRLHFGLDDGTAGAGAEGAGPGHPRSDPGVRLSDALLVCAIEWRERYPDTEVVVISRDPGLRLRACILDFETEDYVDRKVLDDVELLYRGLDVIEDSTNPVPAPNLDLDPDPDLAPEDKSDQPAGWRCIELTSPPTRSWLPHQCLYNEHLEALVSRPGDAGAATVARIARQYRRPGAGVWSIHARNREQNFALNLLMDPEVDFVTLVGTAGSGKTLLALAAGLEQTLGNNLYKEIIVTRATVPVGDDIGFLPGTEEEKMTPWMGALIDNLEVLAESGAATGSSARSGGGSWGRAASDDLLHKRIKLRSLNFMRGRTFLNRYVILDEAQNLTPEQMKTLITRSGPGSKMICLGNIAQIDTPHVTETTSGLTYVVDRLKDWKHSGHITLQRGERSRLADQAAKVL